MFSFSDMDSTCFDRYKDMENCITPLPEVSSGTEVAGGALRKWPDRAFAIPPRISSGSVSGINTAKFQEDNDLWKKRVEYYKNLVYQLHKGMIRNVMDMNAHLGGFAAALLEYPLWVMNVVPANSKPNTLGVIYERGLIGTYQDWCEAFSTYPRTYDLIHAGGVFTIYQDRYSETKLFLVKLVRINVLNHVLFSPLLKVRHHGHPSRDG